MAKTVPEAGDVMPTQPALDNPLSGLAATAVVAFTLYVCVPVIGAAVSLKLSAVVVEPTGVVVSLSR